MGGVLDLVCVLSADVWQVVTDLLIDFLFYCSTLTLHMLIKAEDSHLIFHKTSLSVQILSRETLSTFLKQGIISAGHCDGVDVKPESDPNVCVCVHPSAALRLTGKQYRFVIQIFPSLHSSAVKQQDFFVMMMVYNQMSLIVCRT